MNLPIHALGTQGLDEKRQDTFDRGIPPGKQMNFVLANPPFNLRDWTRREDDHWV